jgi:hypothetical protein
VHVLLIGGLAFPLGADNAQWLEQRIRTTFVDASHRPREVDGVVCLQLADLLAEEHPGHGLEPIELTLPQARGLTKHVLVPSVAQEHEMERLYDALLRFVGDNT